MTQYKLVIPEPGSDVGFRVTTTTPLARIVAVLRRLNPDAPARQLLLAADRVRNASRPAARSAKPAAEVSREPGPDQFDSGADSGGPETAPGEPESVVAEQEPPTVTIDDAPDPTRDEVREWLAAQGREPLKPGRIPKHILAEYREANREQILASLVPVTDGGEPIPADVPPEV